MDHRFDHHSLTELIELQQEVEQTIRRLYERDLALMDTDVVGSTAYFQQHGDVAGRSLQQRHFRVLEKVLEAGNGTMFNTAGDGAFSFFDTAEQAVGAAIEMQRLIIADNLNATRGHELAVKIGVHYGSALQDGKVLAGDAVNLCARVASLATAGMITLTRDTFSQLGGDYRMLCQPFQTTQVKGISEPVEVMTLDWMKDDTYPDRVRIEETGQEIALQMHLDVISIGRLRPRDNQPGNTIVLRLDDVEQTRKISRYHVELERRPDGYYLRAISDAPTEVDGKNLSKGEEVPIYPGSLVRLSKAASLRFLGSGMDDTNAESSDIGKTSVYIPDD